MFVRSGRASARRCLPVEPSAVPEDHGTSRVSSARRRRDDYLEQAWRGDNQKGWRRRHRVTTTYRVWQKRTCIPPVLYRRGSGDAQILWSSSDVEVADEAGVLLDVVVAQLRLAAHQRLDHGLGILRDADLQERALPGVH